MIIGADECGYGCLAGPVVVCAVKADDNWSIDGLNDSKKLSEKKRVAMRDKLKILIENNEISHYIALRDNKYIDQVGIAKALKECYVECFLKLNSDLASKIIVDGILKFHGYGVDSHDITAIVKADTKIPSVMAASILGKVYRDELMNNMHKEFEVYDWQSNKGYGSSKHLNAIEKNGHCVYHRLSYEPLKGKK